MGPVRLGCATRARGHPSAAQLDWLMLACAREPIGAQTAESPAWESLRPTALGLGSRSIDAPGLRLRLLSSLGPRPHVSGVRWSTPESHWFRPVLVDGW